MVEHSAVNRRVASSNLARGAKFSFFFSEFTNSGPCHFSVKFRGGIFAIPSALLCRDARAVYPLICCSIPSRSFAGTVRRADSWTWNTGSAEFEFVNWSEWRTLVGSSGIQ
jgi:hypothetical protein